MMLASSSSLRSRYGLAVKSSYRPSPTLITLAATRAIHLHPSRRVATTLPRSTSLAQPRPQPQLHVLATAQRWFSSTRITWASLASHPPGEISVLMSHPTPESLRALEEEDGDEYDIDLLPLKEAQLQMTDRAAEQLQRIAARENDTNAALRISVESGGCHGYQYKMELARERRPDDYHFSHPSIKPSNIIVDAVSMSLLKGSVIDFATELIGSSFKVVENPQAKGSGCGCGVSWELKV